MTRPVLRVPHLPRLTRLLLGVLGALLLAIAALTYSVSQSQAPRLKVFVEQFAESDSAPEQLARLQRARRSLEAWQSADARRWKPGGYGFSSSLVSVLGVGLLFLAIRARTE